VNHAPVLPILVPALAAGLLLALGSAPLAVQRLIGIASTAAVLLTSLYLVDIAGSGSLTVYALGDWPGPFGIVLVVDRLSALLTALTAVVALAALLHAMLHWDTRGRHFHALFQFQLMGLMGAFLTGDLFNLFVFFEVLLIASYCLLLHGMGASRVRAAVHYVVINLTGSAVFLIAVSLLYSVTGTLNMAQLAQRVATLPAADLVLAQAAGLLLLGVFCIKAALFPLYFWLPAAYSSASAPVAALFSIMTKVGVYAIVRVSLLIYGVGGDNGRLETAQWLLPAALVTLVLAALGAVGAVTLTRLIAYLTVASVGSMLTAIALGSAASLAAAVYYLVHSTLVVAALFLLAELLASQRGSAGDRLHAGPSLLQPALLGTLFVVAAATAAGMPPFAGFLGKLLILQSVPEALADGWWVWAVILGTSLMLIISLSRAGSLLFWNVGPALPDARPASAGEIAPLGVLLACSLTLAVCAAPVSRYVDAAAAQLRTPATYISAVLGAAAGDGTTRAPRALPERHAP